jgi:hypothetical protein
MKLEHRNEKVIGLNDFFLRLFRYNVFALALIVLSLGIGTAGYRWSCDLTWLDSFYMSSMILTGMGPVVEMKTDTAKIFSSFYALYSGVAFLSITAVFFAPVIHRILHILHVEKDEQTQ